MQKGNNLLILNLSSLQIIFVKNLIFTYFYKSIIHTNSQLS